jgi:hypothetical protein
MSQKTALQQGQSLGSCSPSSLSLHFLLMQITSRQVRPVAYQDWETSFAIPAPEAFAEDAPAVLSKKRMANSDKSATLPFDPDQTATFERERVGHILNDYLKTIQATPDVSKTDKDFALGLIQEIKRKVWK